MNVTLKSKKAVVLWQNINAEAVLFASEYTYYASHSYLCL